MSRVTYIIKSDTACALRVNPANLVEGRMDVVLDFAVEALRASKEAEVYIVMAGCGEYLVHIRGFEATTTELARALSTGNIRIERGSLRDVLRALQGRGVPLYYLHESGRWIGDVDVPRDSVGFIVGDQDGLSVEDEDMLGSFGIPRLSLGRRPYLSWFIAVILSSILQRRP